MDPSHIPPIHERALLPTLRDADLTPDEKEEGKRRLRMFMTQHPRRRKTRRTSSGRR